MTRQLLSFSLVAALVLGGCSGRAADGSSGLLPAGSTPATAGSVHRQVSATLRVRIPKKVRMGGGRHPRFVSPSTQSATMAVAPAAGCTKCSPAFTHNIGLTATSPNCATGATGTTCSFTFVLTPGSYTGSMTTYEGALNASGIPTGAVLSLDQSFPLSVVAGKANVPTISLYGVPANFLCLPVTGASIAITTAGVCNGGQFLVAPGVTSTFAVYALDIDGNLMLGPGTPTFAASSAGGFSYVTKGNTIAVTPPTFTSASNTLTLTGKSPACTVTGAVCSFTELIAFDSLVAIPNSGNNTVSLFPHLVIAAGGGAPYTTITDGISVPQAVAFDKTGNLFVANQASVTEYAPPYTGAPIATITKNVNLPFAIAIGNKTGALAVLNGGAATAEVFAPPYTLAPDQAMLSTPDATALAFDSQENLWISFFSNSVERFPAAFLYSAVDTLLDHASDGITHPTALLLDVGDNLYVGEGKVDEFPTPYNGMPTTSSPAVSGLSSMAIDNNKGAIVACGTNQVAFFHTNGLLEFDAHSFTASTCEPAFDRLHNLELAFANPDGALTLAYYLEFLTWFAADRTFTSTELSAPLDVATWP